MQQEITIQEDCRSMLQLYKAGLRVDVMFRPYASDCKLDIGCSVCASCVAKYWKMVPSSARLGADCVHAQLCWKIWKQIGRLHSCNLLGDVANIANVLLNASADALILLTQQASLPLVFGGCFKIPTDLTCILSAP